MAMREIVANQFDAMVDQLDAHEQVVIRKLVCFCCGEIYVFLRQEGDMRLLDTSLLTTMANGTL